MTSPTIRKLAAGALAVVGLIHLVLAPGYFSEQAYIGVLFVLGAVLLGVLTVRLWRADDAPSWLLGAITMAAMGIAFVLSRTTGLPGFHESGWELSGVIALALEAGFVAVAAAALRSRPAAAAPAAEEPRFSRAPARSGQQRPRTSRTGV